MKYAARMFAVVLTMLPLLASAQLGSGDKIVAQVPFAFVAGNKIVPAGECVVQLAGVDATTLLIRNRDAKVNVLSLASMAQTGKAAGNYALIFHKFGEQYFLWGMKLEGSRTIYRLPESKAEAELRARNVPAAEQTLLASLR